MAWPASSASSRLLKKGCAEGRSPFAGSLRVSLRYDFFPLPARKGARETVVPTRRDSAPC